jgi:hypothetical protein
MSHPKTRKRAIAVWTMTMTIARGWRPNLSCCSYEGRPRSGLDGLLSLETRTFSPIFSPTRLIQTDPASSSLNEVAYPWGYRTRLDVTGRVAMQKVEGSSPFIRFENPRKSRVFVLEEDNVGPR